MSTGRSLPYSTTFISFGVSLVNDTFCIGITSQLQWSKLLPRNQFPHEITNIIKTSAPRKYLCSMILEHYRSIEKPFDGKVVSCFPLEQLSEMYEYIITVITSTVADEQYMLEQWTEPPVMVGVKPIVDLTEISSGVNWILLGKKSRPIVINRCS